MIRYFYHKIEIIRVFFGKSLKCLVSNVIVWDSKVKLPFNTPWKHNEDWIIPPLILNLRIGNGLLVS